MVSSRADDAVSRWATAKITRAVPTLTIGYVTTSSAGWLGYASRSGPAITTAAVQRFSTLAIRRSGLLQRNVGHWVVAVDDVLHIPELDACGDHPTPQIPICRQPVAP